MSLTARSSRGIDVAFAGAMLFGMARGFKWLQPQKKRGRRLNAAAPKGLSLYGAGAFAVQSLFNRFVFL